MFGSIYGSFPVRSIYDDAQLLSEEEISEGEKEKEEEEHVISLHNNPSLRVTDLQKR